MEDKNIFIFDLDGTIINNSKPLNKRIADKINEIESAGNKVIFATSRSLRGVKAVLPKHLWNNTLILCNGAFVIDKGKEVLSNFINKDECLELLSYLCDKQIQFYAELGRELYIPNYVTHNFISCLIDEAQGENIFSDIMNIHDRVYKIAIVESMGEKEFYQFSKLLTISNAYRHSDKSVDVVALNISKWEALEKLKILKGYKKVVAFGNDENDIEMLQNADIGVAVCSRNEKLLDVSDLRIESSNPEEIVKIIDEVLCK